MKLNKISTPLKIIIGLTVIAAGVTAYYIYNVLNTFTPTNETAALPVEVEVDETVPAGEIVEDVAPSQPAIWSQTLIDLGGGKLKDSNNNLYYIDGDGNIIDDSGTIFDDATGQVLSYY